MEGLGLGLTGSAKPLLVRPVQLEPPKLPTLPTKQGRPSLTSHSLSMDVRGVAATRPLLIFSATGMSHHGAGRPVYGDDATGSSSSSSASEQISPPGAPLALGRSLAGKLVARAPPEALRRPAGPGSAGSSAGASSSSSSAAVAAEGLLTGGPAAHLRTSSSGGAGPGAGGVLDADAIEQLRLRAVRRLREQREQREQQQAEERQRLTEAKTRANKMEQKSRDLKEAADQRRAEVYAINTLMAARDDGAFRVFVAARRGELDAIEARHDREMAEIEESKGREAQAKEAAIQKRLRAASDEVARARLQAEAEAAESVKGRESRKEELRTKEEEREVWRSQVYAINKLMAARDASAYGEFKRSRGVEDDEAPETAQPSSPPPRPRPSSPRHGRDLMYPDAISEEDKLKPYRTASSLISKSACAGWPSVARKSKDTSARSGADGGAAAGSRKSGPPGERSGGRSSSSGTTDADLQIADAKMALLLNHGLNRTWGGPGERDLGADSGDERDAAIVARLARPREGQRDYDLDDAKARKAATVWQQQQHQEKERHARREHKREETFHAREEREIFRAQVYAMNRLFRAKEEASFEQFRLQREAEGLGSTSAPSKMARELADAEAAEAADFGPMLSGPKATAASRRLDRLLAETLEPPTGANSSVDPLDRTLLNGNAAPPSRPLPLPPPPVAAAGPLASPRANRIGKLDPAQRLLQNSPYAKSLNAQVADAAAAAF